MNGGLIWNKKKMNGNIMSDKEMLLAYCNDQIELFKLDRKGMSEHEWNLRIQQIRNDKVTDHITKDWLTVFSICQSTKDSEFSAYLLQLANTYKSS